METSTPSVAGVGKRALVLDLVVENGARLHHRATRALVAPSIEPAITPLEDERHRIEGNGIGEHGNTAEHTLNHTIARRANGLPVWPDLHQCQSFTRRPDCGDHCAAEHDVCCRLPRGRLLSRW